MATQDTAGPSDVELPAADTPPATFADPGVPPHRHRVTDKDPAAAKRAERVVALFFSLSVVGTLTAMVGYFVFRLEGEREYAEQMMQVRLSTTTIGVGMALALLGIGIGAVHWARTIMDDTERTEQRHVQRSTDAERAEAIAILKQGAEESGLARRPLIMRTMLGAMAVLPLPIVVMLRDLGPLPGNTLSTTMWKAGMRLVKDPNGEPIKASDVTIGSVFHVMPEGIEEADEVENERAKAAVLVMRLAPEDLTEESQAGGVDGIVAYSKICTHLGCPVALYEQQTHHLLCPCHQSTFDVTKNCEVVFGPAKRALPQLPITVDDEGYLVAKDGFGEAVGPSFWELG